MKLYYHPLSPYGRKVLFAAYEKGIELERAIVTPDRWEGQAASMNQVYPLGLTPVLVGDDGEVWAESSVIVEYLEQLQPEPRLIPLNPSEALRARMLERIIDAYLIAPAGRLVFLRRREQDARANSRASELSRRVESTLEYLEARLASRGAFLVGDGASTADVSGCAGIAVLEGLGFPLSRYQFVARWSARLSSRRAWQRILEETRSFSEGALR